MEPIRINYFNKYNIAPYLAKRIGVYDEEGNRVGFVELNDLRKSFDERLYRVGLMSDTHYNDSDDTDDNPETNVYNDDSQYDIDLIKALKFYDDKESVEFVCVAGDISTDRIYHVKNFKLQCDKHAPKTPVYSCKGNHDNKASYGNNEIWKECVSEHNDKKEKIYCDKGDGTSFYFIKTLNSGKKDVYIFLNVDYNNGKSSADYTGDEYIDKLIEDEGRTHQYYNPEVLEWFENVLETFKHDRCFVFTHLFFRQKAGNYNGKTCYYKYYGWDRSRLYNLRGEQFRILNELNNKYKNSIWFTGHSHYSWYWQKRDENINICAHDSNFIEGNKEDNSEGNGVRTGSIDIIDYKCDSAYNVHLPSLARPLKLGVDRDIPYIGNESIVRSNGSGYNDVLNKKGSEGAIMDVYEDYVDIRGIVFKTSDSEGYIDKYTPIATYRIPVGGNNIKQIN